MISKSTLLFFFISIVAHIVYAQDYTFRVLASNGRNNVKTEKQNWKPLKVGTRLQQGDKIKLSKSSYLGLVHASGKTVELKEAGTYDIVALSDKLENNTKSIVSKYADFVISKMSPEVVEQNRKKYASVTGSGERGLYDTDIHIYLPKTVSLLNKTALVSWNFKTSNDVYVITVKNIFAETLLIEKSKGSSFLINYEDNKIKSGQINNIITLEIGLESDANVTSQEIAIKLLDDLEAEKLNIKLNNLKVYLGEKSSLNSLILAEFYEENNLLLDAITSHENAVNLSPDVEYFQQAYDAFLIRNRLKSPADVDSK